MRIIFMGTGEIALPTLRYLLDQASEKGDDEVVAVYTQPDKRVGRSQKLTSPQVKVLAESYGVPVYQPERLRGDEDALQVFSELAPDLVIVMAYGQILPKAFLAVQKLACVNLHASLLPRHRGASPIHAAIREGDEESGITLMHVIPQLDAGAMILKRSLRLDPKETGGSLHDRLADLGPEVIAAGRRLFCGSVPLGEAQDESQCTYTGKLQREDGEIDWSASAEEIERLVRAYDPWPGTMTHVEINGTMRQLKLYPHLEVLFSDSDQSPGTVIESGERLVVRCGQGAVVLQGDVQIEGRRRLSVGDFLHGAALPVGSQLGKRFLGK